MSLQSLDKIIFFDIETAPQVENMEDLNEEMQSLWAEKTETLRQRNPQRYPIDKTPQELWGESAIFAEFGRIVCISVGFCFYRGKDLHIKTKSYYGEDERAILMDFFEMLGRFVQSPNHVLCGHNSKEFDIPYICRRATILHIPLPDTLQVAGKKPWDIHHIDTMDLWKFGDVKSFTKLKLLTAIFGIPTPKDDIDGSEVGRVFWQEKDYKRIAVYCQKDVVATAQVFLSLMNEPLIPQDNIESSPL